MNNSSNFYRPLSPNNVKRIDETARQILKSVGVKINDTDCLNRLDKTGAIIDKESGIARFEGAWLDHRSHARLAMDEWHHVAWSWDGQTARVYVDGWLGSANTWDPHELQIRSGDVLIGGAASEEPFFAGSIDEVAIHSRLLTAREIMFLATRTD